MDTLMRLELFIEHSREGAYFTLPFVIDEDIEALTLRYTYRRFDQQETQSGNTVFESRQEVNIIDLGLIAPDGAQVGASGSDKEEIYIDERHATPGYRPWKLAAGTWQILVGTYKVEAQGVLVNYEIRMTGKKMRLLKGDLHTHTVASDGVHSVEELSWKAARHGLDFLAITDHNQMSAAERLSDAGAASAITLIPGVEWTHYHGHANFLGVDRPYDGSFYANTPEEVSARFASARERGALITINHPFEACCEFKFDLNTLPFDCLEIWNGPMRESNLRAVGLWQSMLAAGRKIPICGGSDYHRDTPFIFLGGPTTCVYAESPGASDILAALRQGHAYLTFAPDGPTLELTAGEAMLGDTVAWSQAREVQIKAGGLAAGDVVRVITANSSEVLLQAPTAGRFQATYALAAPGFARIEILRAFLPGLPLLPALISNPIYFDGEK
jgi:hypothetical protein